MTKHFADLSRTRAARNHARAVDRCIYPPGETPLDPCPSFVVEETPTRTRLAHLRLLWEDYHRRRGGGVPTLPVPRWLSCDRGGPGSGPDPGPVLRRWERLRLGYPVAGDPTAPGAAPPERRRRAAVSVPAWRGVPPWSGWVDPTPEGGSVRRAALAAWAGWITAHRPGLRYPKQLPKGSVVRLAGGVAGAGIDRPGIPPWAFRKPATV